MLIPSHYKLVAEMPNHYEIHDSRDGRNFHIAKKGLDLKMHGKLSKIQHFNKGGEAQKIKESDGSTSDIYLPSGINLKPEYQAPNEEIAALPEGGSSHTPTLDEDLSNLPQDQNDIQLPEVQTINDFQANRMHKNAALEDEKSAIEAGAKAEGEAGLKTAKAYEDYSKSLKEDENSPDKIHKRYEDKNSELRKAYEKTEIKPYWENKSTGAKIGSLLAIALGGFGSRPNGENSVLKQINKDIDRDLEAQKNSQSKIMNAYKMNLEAEGNEQKAYLETKNQALHAVQAEAMAYASRIADPVAKARIAPLLADLNAQIAQNTLQRSLLAGSGNGQTLDVDPSRLVPTMIPKEHQAAAFKEIEEMKNLKTLKTAMDKEFDHVDSLFARGLLSPGDRDSAIEAFSGRLVKLAEGSFTKEQADIFKHSFFPIIGDRKATAANKRKRLDELFESMEKGSVFSQSGLDLKNFSPTSFGNSKGQQQKKQFLDWARKNAGSKNPKDQKRLQFIRREFGG